MAGAKGKTKKKPPAKPARSTARGRTAPAPKASSAASTARPAAPAAATPPPPTQPLRNYQPNLTPRPLMRGDFILEKLHQIALTATNLDLSIQFYRDILGLKFITRFDPPGLAFFVLPGGARLMLSASESKATLYFAVDDIDGAVNELKKRGVSFLHAPARIHRDEAGDFGKKGVEEWMALFHDPSGNVIGMVERR